MKKTIMLPIIAILTIICQITNGCLTLSLPNLKILLMKEKDGERNRVGKREVMEAKDILTKKEPLTKMTSTIYITD